MGIAAVILGLLGILLALLATFLFGTVGGVIAGALGVLAIVLGFLKRRRDQKGGIPAIVIGTLDGFRSADRDAINLMRSMGASRTQIFRHIKLPNALPNFFSGLRITVAYAVVGAVLAEWLGGFAGLGVYMTRVKKSFAYDKMFAVIFLISIISLLLIWLVNVLQKRCMPWEREEPAERD